MDKRIASKNQSLPSPVSDIQRAESDKNNLNRREGNNSYDPENAYITDTYSPRIYAAVGNTPISESSRFNEAGNSGAINFDLGDLGFLEEFDEDFFQKVIAPLWNAPEQGLTNHNQINPADPNSENSGLIFLTNPEDNNVANEQVVNNGTSDSDDFGQSLAALMEGTVYNLKNAGFNFDVNQASNVSELVVNDVAFSNYPVDTTDSSQNTTVYNNKEFELWASGVRETLENFFEYWINTKREIYNKSNGKVSPSDLEDNIGTWFRRWFQLGNRSTFDFRAVNRRRESAEGKNLYRQMLERDCIKNGPIIGDTNNCRLVVPMQSSISSEAISSNEVGRKNGVNSQGDISIIKEEIPNIATHVIPPSSDDVVANAWKQFEEFFLQGQQGRQQSDNGTSMADVLPTTKRLQATNEQLPKRQKTEEVTTSTQGKWVTPEQRIEAIINYLLAQSKSWTKIPTNNIDNAHYTAIHEWLTVHRGDAMAIIYKRYPEYRTKSFLLDIIKTYLFKEHKSKEYIISVCVDILDQDRKFIENHLNKCIDSGDLPKYYCLGNLFNYPNLWK